MPYLPPAQIFRVGLVTGSRVMSAASGNVAYTGMGFRPSVLLLISVVDSSNGASWGYALSPTARAAILRINAGLMTHDDTICIYGQDSVPGEQKGDLVSMDTDGFTLSWTKIGLPTATMFFKVLGFG